ARLVLQPGVGCDLARRHAGEAAGGEPSLRGVEDQLAGGRRLAGRGGGASGHLSPAYPNKRSFVKARFDFSRRRRRPRRLAVAAVGDAVAVAVPGLAALLAAVRRQGDVRDREAIDDVDAAEALEPMRLAAHAGQVAPPAEPGHLAPRGAFARTGVGDAAAGEV